jgi:hypothetical protein
MLKGRGSFECDFSIERTGPPRPFLQCPVCFPHPVFGDRLGCPQCDFAEGGNMCVMWLAGDAIDASGEPTECRGLACIFGLPLTRSTEPTQRFVGDPQPVLYELLDFAECGAEPIGLAVAQANMGCERVRWSGGDLNNEEIRIGNAPRDTIEPSRHREIIPDPSMETASDPVAFEARSNDTDGIADAGSHGGDGFASPIVGE